MAVLLFSGAAWIILLRAATLPDFDKASSGVFCVAVVKRGVELAAERPNVYRSCLHLDVLSSGGAQQELLKR